MSFRKTALISAATASLALGVAAPARADYAGDVNATAGLSSFWRLGETSGTTARDARGLRPGTYLGGVKLRQPAAPAGASDPSVAFDGVDDAVSVGDTLDASGTSAFSYEGWVRPSSVGAAATWRRVISKEASDSARSGYVLVLAPDSASVERRQRLSFERRSSTGSDAVLSTTALRAGGWYHFAVTYDGATLRLYVNGRLEGSSASRRTLPNTTATLRLGASSRGSSPFGGQLDEIAAYGRALPATTVKAHYDSGRAPAPAPAPAPSPAPAPTTWAKATTRPPSSPILADAEAAARVRRTGWEPRPDNATANARVPTADELTTFRSASRNQSPYVPSVTGAFTGTTDEIIQWAAHKWGVDEDLLRAEAVQESSWHESAAGDGGISFGLLQIKSTIWRGTAPLSKLSTAFNADMYGAIIRQCYDGKADWLGNGYAAGDLWGCLGYYFSGNWYDADATAYIDSVKRHLAAREWERADF